jgi:hypothetical protein
MDKNIKTKKGSKAREFEGRSITTLPKSKGKLTTPSN